jgi:hypothetical protein
VKDLHHQSFAARIDRADANVAIAADNGVDGIGGLALAEYLRTIARLRNDTALSEMRERFGCQGFECDDPRQQCGRPPLGIAHGDSIGDDCFAVTQNRPRE